MKGAQDLDRDHPDDASIEEAGGAASQDHEKEQTPDLRVAYDRLFLAAVRGGASSPSVQVQHCLIAAVNALRSILRTRDVWILSLGAHSGDEASWTIDALLPRNAPASLRQCIGGPISQLLATPEHWIYRIPLYSIGASRLNYSEYRLLVPRTRSSIPPEKLGALLDHATTVLGHMLPLYQELAANRHARPFLHRTVFARSADDYPAYRVLKACKLAVPCWRSLSFWHVSRTERRLERVAQEPEFKHASFLLDAIPDDLVTNFPAMLCIERSASAGERTELMVRAFSSRQGAVFGTQRRTFSFVTARATRTVLHVRAPDNGRRHTKKT